MRVIPVIDLKAGAVVRGVAGQRDQYRPVQSQLVASSAPGPVARALCDVTGGEQLYIADLDAIAGATPDWRAYTEVLAEQAAPMIDAGVATQRDARSLVEFAEQRAADASIVVALESSSGPGQLQQVFDAIGPERAVFSLDLREGRPWTTADAWRDLPAEEIAARAVAGGFRRMIVLDVAAVGVGAGPTVLELCRMLRAHHPQIELISGGGVRSADDLRAFCEAGCEGVLVASALHDCRITRVDLEQQDWCE